MGTSALPLALPINTLFLQIHLQLLYERAYRLLSALTIQPNVFRLKVG